MDENNTYLGTLKFMGEDEDKNFYVQVDIVRSGPNRNGWDFQNMETLCKTFLGTPLLCAYLPNQIGDGHNFREKTLPTGEVWAEYCRRAGIPEDGAWLESVLNYERDVLLAR